MALLKPITDKCIMDSVMGSCQHIKFIDRKSETVIDGVKHITIEQLVNVPPGKHLVCGSMVVSSGWSTVQVEPKK